MAVKTVGIFLGTMLLVLSLLETLSQVSANNTKEWSRMWLWLLSVIILSF